MTVAERKNILLNKYKLSPILADRVLSEFSTDDFDLGKIEEYIKAKPKPFVKWVGGKRQLLSQFKDLGLYPPTDFDYIKNTYFEPFVGGGAVFFDLLPQKAVLSDFNTELVATYNAIKTQVDDLITTLNSGYYVYNKERFLEIRSLPREKDLSELETAARFIYLNRTCFNGMYRVNKSGHFNVPFGKYDNPQICDEINLQSVSKALQKVVIKNERYEKVLDKAKSGDFVYFDPPYYPVSKTASFTAYTNDAFLEKEQETLRDTFLELHRRGCFVMLSNSDTTFVKDLFKPYAKDGITIHKVQAGRAINSKAEGRGKIFEVLVTNY